MLHDGPFEALGALQPDTRVSLTAAVAAAVALAAVIAAIAAIAAISAPVPLRLRGAWSIVLQLRLC